MPSIGTCCNTDHRQGPHRFIEPPEPIDPSAGHPLVLWYVGQLTADTRRGREYCWAEHVLRDGVYTPKAFPCYSGPLLSVRPAP